MKMNYDKSKILLRSFLDLLIVNSRNLSFQLIRINQKLVYLKREN